MSVVMQISDPHFGTEQADDECADNASELWGRVLRAAAVASTVPRRELLVPCSLGALGHYLRRARAQVTDHPFADS